MQQNATVLLKFTIPELEPLPHEEQQRILTSCWESDAVQAAWRRYWSRPQQLGFIPILPIAIYGAFANIGLCQCCSCHFRNSVDRLGRSVIGVPCIAQGASAHCQGAVGHDIGLQKNVLRLRRNATRPLRTAIDPPRTAKGAPYAATGLLDIAAQP